MQQPMQRRGLCTSGQCCSCSSCGASTSSSSSRPEVHSTTILCVRKGDMVRRTLAGRQARCRAGTIIMQDSYLWEAAQWPCITQGLRTMVRSL